MGESTSLSSTPLPREDAAPIARKGLHEEVAARLRDMIVEGVLEPGVRVPERELCLRLGISRTPLREALTARDGARLGRLLEEHLRHKLDVVKTVILNPR